jgi:hypothetical protein
MSDKIDSDKALADYRKSILRKREKLDGIRQHYKKLADVESDEFKRSVYDRLSQYAKVMDNLFSDISGLATINDSTLVKIEGLRDIVFELQEVKNSPELQEKIRRLFRDYQERF